MRRASLALLALVVHASGARARPAGANVCGGRCCPGWMSRPGPLTCTVPICFPPCKAGGRCVWPGVCASSAHPGPLGGSFSGLPVTSRSGTGGRRQAAKESHHILSHVVVADSGGAPRFATLGGKSVEEGPALDLAAAAVAAASGGPGPPAHVLQAMRDAAQRLLGSGSTGTVMVKVQRQTVDPRHWRLSAATSPHLVHSVNRLRNSVTNVNLHTNAAGTSQNHNILPHKRARPQESRTSLTYGLYNNVLPPGPPAPHIPSLTPKGISQVSQVQVISPSPSCGVRCSRGRCRRVCDSMSRTPSVARQNAPHVRISSPPRKPFRPLVTQRWMRPPPTLSPQIVCPKGFSADETGWCRAVAASQNNARQPKPTDGGRARCYREVDSAGCSLPLAHVVPHLVCCCVLGKAWGPRCQRCPSPGSDEFRQLCPPSFSFSQENKGKAPPSKILTLKFPEAVPYFPEPRPPTTSLLSARLPLGPKISSRHHFKVVQAPAVTIHRVVPVGPHRETSQAQTQLRKPIIAAAAAAASEGGSQRGTHHHRVHLRNGGGGKKEDAVNVRHHHIVRIPQVPNAPITLVYDRSTIPSKKGSEHFDVRAEHRVVPLVKEVHKHSKPMGRLDLRSHHHKGSRVRPGHLYPSSPVAVNLVRFQQSRRLEETKGAMGRNKRPVQDHRMGEQTLAARELQEKFLVTNLGKPLPEPNVNIVNREEGANIEVNVDMTHQEHNEFTTWKIDALPNWQPKFRFQQQANIQPSKKELQPKDIREVVPVFQETTGNRNAEGSPPQDLHIFPTNSSSIAIDNYLHSPISQEDVRLTGHTTYVPLKVVTRSQGGKEGGTHVLDHKLQNISEIQKLDGNVSYELQTEHMTDVELKGEANDAGFGKNDSEGLFHEHKENVSQGQENPGSVDKGHDEDSRPQHIPVTPQVMWRGEEVTGKYGSLHLHVKKTLRGSNITQPERLKGSKSREDGSPLVQGKGHREYEQSRMFPQIKEKEEYMPARRLANSHIPGESKSQGKEDSSIWRQEEIMTPGSNIEKEKHLSSDHEHATPAVRWYGSTEAGFRDGEPKGWGEGHFEKHINRKSEINHDKLDSWRVTVPNYLAYRRPEATQALPGGLKERKPNAPVKMWHHRLENVGHESGKEVKVQGWELESRESDQLETLQIDRLEDQVHEQEEKMKESWRLGWSEAKTVSVPESLEDFKSTGFGPTWGDSRQEEQWGSKSEGKGRAEHWRHVWAEGLNRPEQQRVGQRESRKEDRFKNRQRNRKLGELIGSLEGQDHALPGGQTRLGSVGHRGHGSGVLGGLERAACFLAVEEGAECGAALASNLTLQECCCTLGGTWGSCRGQPCPTFPSEELSFLCPGGRGYIPLDPMRPDLQPYQDADECLLFERTACRGGFCVNQQGGFLCHCRDSFYYDFVHLACYDVDECTDEGRCMGGECVNTPGSYSCFCHPPQVLDPSGQACLNGSEPAEDDISVHLDVCWNIDVQLMCSELVQRQTTYTECCCLFGQAWGMECALCPLQSSEDYAQLCNLPRAGGSRSTERRDFFEPHFLPDGDEELPLPDFMYHGGADGLQETAPLHGPEVLEVEMPADECGVLSGCENGRCIRVQHGYTCQCHEGYRLHTARMACLDVDECEQKPPPCGTYRCLNSPGSYSCL